MRLYLIILLLAVQNPYPTVYWNQEGVYGIQYAQTTLQYKLYQTTPNNNESIFLLSQITCVATGNIPGCIQPPGPCVNVACEAPLPQISKESGVKFELTAQDEYGNESPKSLPTYLGAVKPGNLVFTK